MQNECKIASCRLPISEDCLFLMKDETSFQGGFYNLFSVLAFLLPSIVIDFEPFRDLIFFLLKHSNILTKFIEII